MFKGAGIKGASFHHSSSDFAKARLIGDPANHLEIRAEEISAVVGLIGQVQALRQMLCALLAVTWQLPAPLRARVFAELTVCHGPARRNRSHLRADRRFPAKRQFHPGIGP
jgi:hypothetical protein